MPTELDHHLLGHPRSDHRELGLDQTTLARDRDPDGEASCKIGLSVRAPGSNLRVCTSVGCVCVELAPCSVTQQDTQTSEMVSMGCFDARGYNEGSIDTNHASHLGSTTLMS